MMSGSAVFLEKMFLRNVITLSVYHCKNNKAFDIKFASLVTFDKKEMSIQATEYPAYFETYIKLVDSDTKLKDELRDSFAEDIVFLQSISEDKKDYAYADGKWTIGEVFQHVVDVELVMSHRAFRISRLDQTNLPGFDHVAYAAVADVSKKSLADLIKELMQVRDVTKIHFDKLDEETLSKRGLISGNTMSIRALGYIIIGHLKHHIKILKESYLDNA